MTVNELITYLNQFPADLPVLVEGYESGWDSVIKLEQDDVQQYRHCQEWDGEFWRLSEFKNPTQQGEPAVLLQGKRFKFR